MFEIIPSRDSSVIAVEVKGEATGADAKVVDQYAEEHYGQNEKFNVFAVIHELKGMTLEGLLKGMKTDAKRWNQFRKFAVVSDKNWIETSAKAAAVLPGIEVKVFEKNQTDEAWDWLKK